MVGLELYSDHLMGPLYQKAYQVGTYLTEVNGSSCGSSVILHVPLQIISPNGQTLSGCLNWVVMSAALKNQRLKK